MTPNPNMFALEPLDRAGHLRRDAAWLEAALNAPETKLMPFLGVKPFVTEEGGQIAAGWLAPHARSLGGADAPLAFLGNDTKGVAHFAIQLNEAGPLEGLGRFEELRPLAAMLPAQDLSIIGTAKALFEWNARHGFCANCGARTRLVEAGWKRQCDECGAEHFPRVDPVVIMVPYKGERMALGRQKVWPKGMYSALAGFMEPGETIEATVARETLEEVGLVVTDVRLHSSQPWPFPSSLMLGALCEVAGDALKVDESELETARWFTRDEAKQLIAGTHPDCFSPPPFAIAHQLIKSWAEEG